VRVRIGTRWESGRQRSGYAKLLLVEGGCFDVYLLKFPPGSRVPPHRDALAGARHYRLNLVLIPAARGGEFVCSEAIVDRPRIKLFRPDVHEHEVREIEAGTRWVLSIGVALTS
jgi:hypothetical protein